MAATWKEVVPLFPEFTQWIVQKYGPLPDGEITESDWSRYIQEYEVTRE